MKIAMLGLRAIGQDPENNPDLANIFSGVETAVEEICTRLAERGHDVTVFCRGRYNPENTHIYKGVRLKNLPAIYSKHLEAISHTFLSAIRCMGGYDIVHFHATGPSLFSGLPRLTGTSTVATVHGLDWQRQKWGAFARAVLKSGAWAAGHFPNSTIVVSKELRSFYEEEYDRKAVYIPNGVNRAEPAHLDKLKRFNLDKNKYLLYLGRLVPEKGCHLLIEAFKQIKTEHKLLIAGGSSYTSKYIERLKSAAADDARIIFAGALHGREKDEAFTNASFLVMPSSLEGMPIVMLEAMSYACPVLCSDIPVHVDVTTMPDDNKPIAEIFNLASPSDLIDKLRHCIDHPQPLQLMAEKAKEHVLREYSWDRITDTTEMLYQSLLRHITHVKNQSETADDVI